MNEWSQKRRRIILSIIFGVLIFVIGLPLFFFLYRSPTCSDGKQNGDEVGIDCGGGCEMLCQADNLPIVSKGDPQVVRVGSTTYAVALSAENPNINSDILRAGYLFKIFDASSTVPVMIVDGETYIPKNGRFVVFGGPYDFVEAVPARATFEWKKESLVWNTNSKEVPDLIIENKFISEEASEPKITAELYNPTLDAVVNVELTVVVSDISGNTIGVSKTFVESIDKNERVPIVYTWPQSFDGVPAQIDVFIKILPDKSFL